MQIELRLPDPANIRLMVRRYDPELDNVVSILSDVCDSIGSSGELTVSGFGEQRWPATVDPDLAVLLEQVPEVLKAVASRQETTLDFYEQGLERYISLIPVGDDYRLTCRSLSSWQPGPSVELMSGSDVETMLLRVRDAFIAFLAQASPTLAKHPWVLDWMKGLKIW